MINTIRNITIAATLAAAMSSAAPAFAENTQSTDLQPLQAHTVNMTDYTAVVYYTVQRNGDYDVVTTIGPNVDVEGQTLQHRVTIKPGQTYELSMDTGSFELAANVIRFAAHGDSLVVASR